MISGTLVKILSIAILIIVAVVLILGIGTFFKELDIKNLNIYIDPPITLAKKFSLRGVPTTILFNKEGKEFARIMGSIDFNDEEFINWLKFYN